MPVHFNSIMSKDKEEKYLSAILNYDIENPDNVFVNENKDKFIIYKNIIDKKTNTIIGKTTITFITRNNAHELVDIDLTLNSDKKTTLLFIAKDKQSSDANEYYQVADTNKTVHFDIETVSRFKINNELENTKQQVGISMFPFELNFFNDINELDKLFGFDKTVETTSNMKVCGFSEQFMGEGYIFLENDKPCSFIIGKIVDFQDVNAVIGNEDLEFTILKVKTAIGIVPMALSKDVFDIRNLKRNMIVATYANVKAEF